MGISIDEVIKEMEEEYAVFLEGTGLDNKSRMKEERKNNPDCNRVCTANEITLDILRKYKKIEEIYKNWSYGSDSCDCMKDIEKVMLDGDDN